MFFVDNFIWFVYKIQGDFVTIVFDFLWLIIHIMHLLGAYFGAANRGWLQVKIRGYIYNIFITPSKGAKCKASPISASVYEWQLR